MDSGAQGAGSGVIVVIEGHESRALAFHAGSGADNLGDQNWYPAAR